MIKDKTRFEALRKEAERIVREQGIRTPDPEGLDLLRLANELEVQQVELGMQNEELQRVNRELETSRTEYVDLYESAPVAFVTVNEEGVIELDNHAATRLLGSGSSLVGRPFESLIHPADRPLYHACVKRVAQRLMPGSCELRLKVKGRILHVTLEVAAKWDRDGVLHWRLALVDITERKEYESALRRSHDELEVRVQERTVELKEMNEKLQKSNQALQEFASIASHDLQEPLRKVQMFGELIRNRYENALGDDGNRFVFHMAYAAQRMQSLLNALLDYARVTSRAKPFVEVSLNSLIQNVLSDLEARIHQTGGRVEVESLPTIQADSTQMRQLFQNLIGNALKFHKGDEKPFVKVSSQSSNEHFRIIVADNGIGFDEKYLPIVFSPFQRLHGKSSNYEGTGMGLAICKKIVERHGGTITARSTPGTGSTFIIDLPVSITQATK